MTEVRVIETTENDAKEEIGIYRLRILQHWYYPDEGYNSFPPYYGLYQVVIPSNKERIQEELAKLQDYAKKNSNITFVLKTDVLVGLQDNFIQTSISNHQFKFLSKVYDLAHMRKHPSVNVRTAYRFSTKVPSRNYSECCFSFFGCLSSWGLAKLKPKWVQNKSNSKLIVSNDFAITFSSKKRLYFFTTCHKYVKCHQSNDVFHSSAVIRDLSHERNHRHAINLPVFIPTGTWCSTKPKIEHILMLWQFGIFCDKFPILNDLYYLIHGEIWTIIMDYLIGDIKTTFESSIIGPFNDIFPVINNIKRIE
jgi:hypothetical protein